MPTSTHVTLYWNRQGQVNCLAHAPYKGSDTWLWEGWQRIPAYVILRGPVPTCETCRAITREGR